MQAREKDEYESFEKDLNAAGEGVLKILSGSNIPT